MSGRSILWFGLALSVCVTTGCDDEPSTQTGSDVTAEPDQPDQPDQRDGLVDGVATDTLAPDSSADLGDGGGDLLDSNQADLEDDAGQDLADLTTSPKRYDETVFASTHNSYSGAERGTLVEQLDAGIRFIELDAHDDDYLTEGDFRIGHNSPGDDVEGGTNPSDLALRSWLSALDSWSDANPGHTPITLGIDLKDSLTDNDSFASGNLGALNAAVSDVLGPKLVHPADVAGGWPLVDEMSDQFVVVMSGDEGTRLGYRRDRGSEPNVAIDSQGRVVEVHASGTGTLWYWTGQYNDVDGTVTWHRHGRYDTGRRPSIALHDNGWLVEVHQSELAATIWSHVGELGADYEITWSASTQYDDGNRPTVRFNAPTDMSDTTVSERHEDILGVNRHAWDGEVTGPAGAVVWSNNQPTTEPLFDNQSETRAARTVSVSTGADGSSPGDTLRYSTDRVTDARIRFDQLLFVEVQTSVNTELMNDDELWFYAIAAFFSGVAEGWRRDGKVVRLWGFNDSGLRPNPAVNFPATDNPFDSWYQDYIASEQ